MIQVVPVHKLMLLKDFSKLFKLCVKVMVILLKAMKLLKGGGDVLLWGLYNSWHYGHLIIGTVSVSSFELAGGF